MFKFTTAQDGCLVSSNYIPFNKHLRYLIKKIYIVCRVDNPAVGIALSCRCFSFLVFHLITRTGVRMHFAFPNVLHTGTHHSHTHPQPTAIGECISNSLSIFNSIWIHFPSRSSSSHIAYRTQCAYSQMIPEQTERKQYFRFCLWHKQFSASCGTHRLNPFFLIDRHPFAFNIEEYIYISF